MVRYASLVVAIAGVLVVSQSQAHSQTACPANPPIGTKCTQERTLKVRSGYPSSATGNFSYTPPSGYRLMDLKVEEYARFGEGGNVNINFVRGGQVTRIRNIVSNYNKTLYEQLAKNKSYAQWAAAKVGGESEALEKQIRENSARSALLDDTYSNVDRVNADVTVRGRCTRSAPFVGCVDNQGGKYEGAVKFQLEFVGTPESIEAANTALINRMNTVLAELEQIKQKALAAQPAPAPAPAPSTPTSVASPAPAPAPSTSTVDNPPDKNTIDNSDGAEDDRGTGTGGDSESEDERPSL